MLKTVGFPSTRTGDQTIVDGNQVFATAGKGIDFSANASAPGMTNELLDWYEEGTWTATLGGFITDPTVPVTATGYYTRVGRQVTVTVAFNNVNTVGGSGAILVRGLPFAPSVLGIGAVNLSGFGSAPAVSYIGAGSTTFSIYDAVNNANIGLVAGAGKYLVTTVTYFV